jgi:NADH:ubiquinone oxidoreductase subunit 2 (subunit N)
VFFVGFGAPQWLSADWGMLIAVLSAITMTVGNITALVQSNIKRLFGYSSIAQAGYLMVGLATIGISGSADAIGRSTLLFFLLSYTVTNLGAFIAIIAITNTIKRMIYSRRIRWVERIYLTRNRMLHKKNREPHLASRNRRGTPTCRCLRRCA